MITNLLKVLLLSFSRSIIGLILFAAMSSIKLKLSKTWQYYIWLVVVLRLIIPYKPKVNLMSCLYNVMENNNLIVGASSNVSMIGAVGIISKYIGVV